MANDLDHQQPDYTFRFEKGLEQLAEFDEAEAFAPLLSLFEDEAPFDEPMFSIIRLIERSKTKAYVSLLLGELSSFVKTSPRWASIVVMRLLNSEEDRQELAEQVKGAPPQACENLKWLLEAINKRGEVFEGKTKPILEGLTSA
jgi:hypothetical protein